MNDDNKQLVRRWFEEVWNQNRESTIDELLSPQGVGFGLTATESEVTSTQFKPFVRNFRDAFPDLHMEIEDMVAEGDKVAVRLRVTGTHKGGGLGFPATGRKIDITAITIIQFANGQLVQGWNNWEQLGLIPTPTRATAARSGGPVQQLGMAPRPVNMTNCWRSALKAVL